MLQSNTVEKVSFEGHGTCTISHGKVVCDQVLETIKTMNGYIFRAKSSNMICSSDVSLFGNNIRIGGQSVMTMGDKTVVRNGSEYYEISADQLSLNGITYQPYFPQHGCYAGKKIFLPIGFLDSHTTGNNNNNNNGGLLADRKIEEVKQVKEFVFDYPVKLTNIECSGQVKVLVDADTISGTNLSATISGQSSIRLNNASILSGILKIVTSGQSSFNGHGSRAKDLNAQSSGQSSIQNVHGNNSVCVSTSGQSSCRLSASPGANVDKTQTGQSTCIVTRA